MPPQNKVRSVLRKMNIPIPEPFDSDFFARTVVMGAFQLELPE